MTGLLTIESNGSHWAGEDPDPIEALIECLTSQTLDPRFAYYSRDAQGVSSFHGNFLKVSAVYSVDVTTGSELDVMLTRLHETNAGWLLDLSTVKDTMPQLPTPTPKPQPEKQPDTLFS